MCLVLGFVFVCVQTGPEGFPNIAKLMCNDSVSLTTLAPYSDEVITVPVPVLIVAFVIGVVFLVCLVTLLKSRRVGPWHEIPVCI